MEHFKKTARFATLGLSLAATGSAFALGSAETADFDVKVKILPKLELIKTSDLIFPTQVEGSVTTPLTVLAASAEAATLTVDGASGYDVKVNLTSDSIVMLLDGVAGNSAIDDKNIPVSNFIITGDGNTATGTADLAMTMDGSAMEIRVGATASPTNSDDPGDYIASNTVSVVYVDLP